MKPVTELLNQNEFLKSLFESIPCGVLIIDRDRRIQAVNNVMERAFGVSKAEAIDKRGGEALRCIYAFKSPEGCGFADECRNCGDSNTALEALTGKQIEVGGIAIHRLASGKIVEDWASMDMLGMMQQLGVIPSPGQAGG